MARPIFKLYTRNLLAFHDKPRIFIPIVRDDEARVAELVSLFEISHRTSSLLAELEEFLHKRSRILTAWIDAVSYLPNAAFVQPIHWAVEIKSQFRFDHLEY